MRGIAHPIRSATQLPEFYRAPLGIAVAVTALLATYLIVPLRAFPLLLALPAAILTTWWLGILSGAICAVTESILIETLLRHDEFRLSLGDGQGNARLAAFLFLSISLGWIARRLAWERSQQIRLATVERELTEERALASAELREQEAILQIALRANGMGLWIWDLEKNTIRRTDAMFRMVGREPGCIRPVPEDWLQFVHPDDITRVEEAFRQTQCSGMDFHSQYRVILPDGSIRWLESQGKCQQNAHGKVHRLVGVIADITHHKQAEEAMVRAEKLAVAGRLAASIAHEINNPLEALANLLYLVTISDTTETARAYGAQALEELMRVSLVTQQTLKFHRQTGTPKMVKLSEIVDMVLTLFRGKLCTAQVRVEVRPEREMAVSCMPSETQQIFANLVSNAIDAMPKGGRLTIRLRPSCDWRDHQTPGMRVTFFDTGIGMERTTIHHIFDPFFTTKAETGTGLGMWVVAQLVERHHGRVHVWSTQKTGASGTAFSIFLPLRETAGELPTVKDAPPIFQMPIVSSLMDA